MKSGLTAALAIARKDLQTELRTRESITASLSFSLVILVLFSFAFDLGREELYAISGGLLWLVYSFAGALIVNRSFARELPNDCLDVLISSPAPGWAIFLGKAVAAFFLLVTVELVSLPFFGLFYNIAWWNSLAVLLPVIVLATWGIAVVGVAFSAVTVNVRLRELMLPVLLYPMLIPLLLGAIGTTTALFSQDPDALKSMGSSIQLMIVFDVIYTSLSLYIVEFILIV
ncbi:MAG TPA: heme exporter protein CcmB [Bryobacteraceae bacterium]|nr:heme exporter protein CcmB [Bryobacteraceae bacterium]